MSDTSNTLFAGSDLAVRSDLVEAHERAWAAIAAPGTWLNGEQRVAVAAEIRHARECAQCERIKAALSPNAVPGMHESLGKLGAAQVELVHRVVGDPGRLSEKWSQTVLARGLSEGEYVEIVGLIAMVMMLDTCMRALGLPERALPAPKDGEATRYRPAGARKKAAWLPLVEPEDATEADGPIAGTAVAARLLVARQLPLHAGRIRLPVRQIHPRHSPAAGGNHRRARLGAASMRLLNGGTLLHAP